MATAYLYKAVGSAEAPGALVAKIGGSTGVTPTGVQKVGAYIYVVFAAAITADEKVQLDSFFAARGGVFGAIDTTASATVISALGTSADGNFWRVTIDNVGIPSTTKVQ
jgi:hypothetical protein